MRKRRPAKSRIRKSNGKVNPLFMSRVFDRASHMLRSIILDKISHGQCIKCPEDDQA